MFWKLMLKWCPKRCSVGQHAIAEILIVDANTFNFEFYF